MAIPRLFRRLPNQSADWFAMTQFFIIILIIGNTVTTDMGSIHHSKAIGNRIVFIPLDHFDEGSQGTRTIPTWSDQPLQSPGSVQSQ